MAPCPSGCYNRLKGSFVTRCYDRLDLFVKSFTFLSHSEWKEWLLQNTDRYALSEFLDSSLPRFPILENENVALYKEEVASYLDTFSALILRRGNFLTTTDSF